MTSTTPAEISMFVEHATLQAGVAIAVASTAIPMFVYVRYGRAPGRIAMLLWPWITLGAFLLGAPLFRVVRDSQHPSAAAAVVLGLYALMIVHLTLVALPRMRGPLARWLIVVPGTALTCACLIAHPFVAAAAVARAFGLARVGPALGAALTGLELTPLVLAVLALAPSMRPRRETVRVAPSAERPRRPTRLACERSPGEGARATETTLRIAQLTDTHLGGLVTVAGLRALVERLLARRPDIVVLTGDFLALEGMFTPGALREALAPLRALPGRCFAALGNHDLDAAAEVREALASSGVRLLIDESALVSTSLGDIEVFGIDHVERDRREHLRRVLATPRAPTARMRVVLLHDPGRFAHLVPPWPDLVLAGHLHGGQIGLLSLGLPWTILTPTRIPDHGFFGFGGSRLYAHRGTGTFGFPLRIGVPAEESVLDVELADLPAPE